ncbi:uncharacterized protein LOC125657080 isoform X2 [Ostrea edulis]|uniref:uncharacterized protein LOC125657080 isoform X2 n=1 Tax=Ostrea edulis TaxID=37623 RepID=UPI0024AEA022|nr:uncharacterized protein LOC125657080 isoform X2 [Ostrea edulis]
MGRNRSQVMILIWVFSSMWLTIATSDSSACTSKPRSCKDILLRNTGSNSGQYKIYTDDGKTVDVFCEFTSVSHGYTYLKDFPGNSFVLSNILSTTNHVKVIHLRTSGKRYSTRMEELDRYQKNYSLSLQLNKNEGFNSPLNAPFLGKFIYVGFLPRSIAANRNTQGYRAGSRNWEFRNCDANPNSYIAFFYNNSPLTTHSYHKRCCYNAYMRKWIDVSTEYTLPIPSEYFRFFEMHMGGCGGYVVPKFNTFSDIVGAVPGFRFDLTCNDLICPNGGSCTMKNGRPVCLCPSGYTGSQCKDKVPHSCKDIAFSRGHVTGEHTIFNRENSPYKVFCEFHQTYGYTFVSNTHVSLNVDDLFEIKSHVLVRYVRSGKQYDSKLGQISSHADKPLTIQYNSNIGFKSPLNAARMKPYLYLGFLDIVTAKSRSTQGYNVNAADQTFRNCDANPNSYLAFYFNKQNRAPVGYYKKCCYTSLMKKWIDVGIPVNRANYLPEAYFLQFEMHMGGCGGYVVSGYNSLANVGGASLGMRFEL